MKTKITALILILVGGFFLIRYMDSEISNAARRNSMDAQGVSNDTSADDSKYSNVTHSISLVYPRDFILTDSFVAEAATVWRNNSTSTGVRIVEVRTPESYLKDTNFNGAWFHVGYTTNANEVKNCLKADNETSAGTATISGVTYSKFTATGAAAGNRYDTISYRTARNNRCYAVEYTIHYGNIQNYDQSSGIKEFDESAVASTFETIVKSFKFTK